MRFAGSESVCGADFSLRCEKQATALHHNCELTRLPSRRMSACVELTRAGVWVRKVDISRHEVDKPGRSCMAGAAGGGGVGGGQGSAKFVPNAGCWLPGDDGVRRARAGVSPSTA